MKSHKIEKPLEKPKKQQKNQSLNQSTRITIKKLVDFTILFIKDFLISYFIIITHWNIKGFVSIRIFLQICQIFWIHHINHL